MTLDTEQVDTFNYPKTCKSHSRPVKVMMPLVETAAQARARPSCKTT